MEGWGGGRGMWRDELEGEVCRGGEEGEVCRGMGRRERYVEGWRGGTGIWMREKHTSSCIFSLLPTVYL